MLNRVNLVLKYLGSNRWCFGDREGYFHIHVHHETETLAKYIGGTTV